MPVTWPRRPVRSAVRSPSLVSGAVISIAMSLDGRGAELGRTIDSLDGFLNRIQPQIPVIQSDIRKLATNLELVEKVAPDLLDGTQSALGPLHTIAAHGADLAKLLTGGRNLADKAGALTTQVRPDLIRFSHEAAKVLPLEQLCLSPQCGFASTCHGNDLSFDDQRRKLELVVDCAEEIWGEA